MVIYTKVTIEGVERITDSIKITKSVGENNSSGTFEITFRNENGYLSNVFSVGNEVLIYADIDVNPATTKRFTGLVEEVTFKGEGSVKEQLILKGRDYTARLQDVTVQPVVYNNTEVSQIVTNIMSNNVTGISTASVMTTTKIKSHVSYTHLPVFDAIKQLAKDVDYIFYVDENKVLHFEPKGSTAVGVLIDYNNTEKSQFRTIDRELANKVWIYGNRILTNWEQSFTATGGSVYSLTYKPHNTRVFVAGSIVPKFGGVFQFQTSAIGSPTQYLVNYDSQQIIFVSGTGWNNIPVSGTDTIKINYDRSVPIVKYGQDDSSIAAYKAREKVIIDKNITDPREAADRLYVELRDGSSPIIEGQVTVNNFIDVTPGNKITVNLPWNNINNQLYDVIEVEYNFNPESVRKRNVTFLKLNKRILDLTDQIKKLALDIRKLQTEDTLDSDLITRGVFATGSVGFNVYSWYVRTKTLGNEFILGNATNGKLGSPAVGIGGGQLTLGSAGANPYVIRASGGLFS